MLPIFSSRQIEREALAALAFLRQAAAAERASPELILRVTSTETRSKDLRTSGTTRTSKTKDTKRS